MGDLSGGIFDFEWDDEKAAENIRKHRISFDEASTIFNDALLMTEADWMHSDEEDRYVSIGSSSQG